MFLDPTASHLLISTSLGENYYLHSQSRQPRPLSRLRGVAIESVAWNPSLPTASTREVLIGTTDGNIYEVYIETSTEFYRREDKYLKSLQKLQDGPITGLWVDVIPEKQDVRRVMIATQSRLLHLIGKVSRSGSEGGGSIYAKLFETEQPAVHEISRMSASAASSLVVSPDSPDASSPDSLIPDRVFAWLSSQGVFYGRLITSPASSELGSKIFSESKLLPVSQLPAIETSLGRKRPHEQVDAIALSQWHVLHLVGGRIVAINRLDDTVVFDQVVLDPGQKAVALLADQQKNTYWLFTTQEIFEIVVTEEDRDVWKIMLKDLHFDAALRYARTAAQKDAVATASGDYLIEKGAYLEAAGIYGKSSKPFEQVALTFIDHDQQDALRKYLLTKIAALKKSSVMQRIMIASWLVEIFMSKLNSLDDTITTKAEISDSLNPAQKTMDQFETTRTEFQDFVTKYKTDLDRKTAYDIISSHGREEELLFFASAVNDYNYVLSYWVQRERWTEALGVLKKQTDPNIFYSYSSVLITHVAADLVDILMRHADLQPRNLIPALLTYNRNFTGSVSQNQAVRYLLYAINTLSTTDAAVHNTLISIYASHPSPDESALLIYLETQGDTPSFDSDFALRLCIQHSRIQSCVHIYSTMGQYLQAVTLALSHKEIALASLIADRPQSNPALRKKLWLLVAKTVIAQESNGIATALAFLSRCPLLKIEDLIPFFPDFVVIDDFKDEICAALESYSSSIDALKSEMDASALTASHIKEEISALDRRYAIVEPGEKCYVCGLPLLARQFFVFPCQHAFHSDCLGRKVVEYGGKAKASRIRELQILVGKGMVGGGKREEAIRELDGLVGASW
jgi:hypothetical protein